MRLLILGCGHIGVRVGEQMRRAGCEVAAARRNPMKLPSDFQRFQVDLTCPESWGSMKAVSPDYILVTPTPQSSDADGYKSGFADVASTLANQPWISGCRRLFWVSSTRVYQEKRGGWVDEGSPLNTDEPQSFFMVAAERLIRRVSTATIIRSAGLYGSTDAMLILRVLRGEGGVVGASYGNRIHREDLSRLIVHCLSRDMLGQSIPPTLLAADNDKAPTHEVERWLAEKLDVNLTFDGIVHKRVRANRRCRNSLMQKIDFHLHFPTWREGYSEVLTRRSKLINKGIVN